MNGYSLCIIGNSHTAAIKQAWTNRAPAVAPDFSLTFFAARAPQFKALDCRQSALVPSDGEFEDRLRMTSGGKDRIEIDRYDAFVLIGLGFRINMITLCGECGVVEHLQWGPVERLLSHACFASVIETALMDSVAIGLLDKIRAVSNRPVLICPSPFRSEKELRESPHRVRPRLSDAEFYRPIVAQTKAIAERIAAERGGEMVWQDDATIATPGFTKAEFAAGALRLQTPAGRTPGDDGQHMNEDFGALMLSAILARLNALSGGRVLAAPPRASAKRAGGRRA